VTDSTQSLRRALHSGAQLQSVVRTMKALAASSIGQYEKSVRSLTDYYRTVELGLAACLRDRDSASIVARNAPTQTGEIRVIVFGSDLGLVGQFNDVVSDYAIKTLARLPRAARIWTVGERVHACLGVAGLPMVGPFAIPNSVRAINPLVEQLQIETEAHHANDENAHLWVIYNRPLSATLYEPAAQRLLPLDASWQQDLCKLSWPNHLLPELIGSSTSLLRALIREYLFISIFRACAESLASENASRLAAMQRADKNIDDLLGQLKSSFNRLRQAGIDEELFDVISGFEALAGSRQPVQV
jgi:F-type H+-transporting ATPase subunit gamma